MSADVSLWWPTPAQPGRIFGDTELDRSDRYNRPLRSVAVISAVVRLILLGAACATAGLVGPDLDTVTLFGSTELTRALVGAVLAVAALRLPAIAADAWFEFRHEPSTVDHRPVPIPGFLAVITVATVAMTAVATVAGWVLFRLTEAQPLWPVALSAVIVASVIAVAVSERSVRYQVGIRTGRFCRDGIDEATEARLQALGRGYGFANVQFLCQRSGFEAKGAVLEPGGSIETLEQSDQMGIAAAYTTGIGPYRRVVVSRALLSEPEPVRDFVVAHELAHMRGRHVLIQTAIGSALAIGFVWLCALLVADGRPWRWFGLTPLDPLALPVIALAIVVFGLGTAPLTAWIARSHERRADLQAASLVGVPDRDALKTLFLAPTTDLDPSWWVRLFAHHPAPAERLTFLRRLDRTAHETTVFTHR